MLSMLKCEEVLSKEAKAVIEQTVVDTVRELRRTGMIRRYDDIAYSQISSRLYDYYKDPEKDPEMGSALEKIKGDEYFDILPMYYQQRITVDWIAESYRCKYQTVGRNKKRLCLRLHSLLS